MILLGRVKAGTGKIESSGTIDLLIEEVLAEMSLREKAEIANLGEDALRLLQLHVDQLVERKSREGMPPGADRQEVMRRIWLRLRATYRLRVVE